MEIRVTETGKIEIISLTDPKTNCCWIQDAIGNCDDLNWNEETEEYEMTQDCYEWWSSYATEYEEADYKYHTYRQSLSNLDQVKLDDLRSYCISQVNDMEMEPSAIYLAIQESKEEA